MTAKRRITAAIIAALAIFGAAGATAASAHASTTHTFYRGAAPETFYRG